MSLNTEQLPAHHHILSTPANKQLHPKTFSEPLERPLTKPSETKMVQIHVERVINLPIEKAWDILGDFSNVHKVHPLVGSVEQKSRNDRGLDAKRTCNLYSGQSVTEQIKKWDEEKHEYTIHLVEGNLPVKSVIATLKAESAGEGKTKLIGDMDMVAKYGPLGKLMEMFLFKPQFGKAVGNLFAGIEHYATTGKEIQKGYNAPTPALIR